MPAEVAMLAYAVQARTFPYEFTILRGHRACMIPTGSWWVGSGRGGCRFTENVQRTNVEGPQKGRGMRTWRELFGCQG